MILSTSTGCSWSLSGEYNSLKSKTGMSIPMNADGYKWPPIWIADAPELFQPRQAPFRYPKYARDFGIEQDFLSFLKKSYPRTVTSPDEAEYVYIPFFWTRYHLQNDYGGYGLEELQAAVDKITTFGVPTFTVCQYDDGPIVTLANCRIFLGSRKTHGNLDAPLLASKLPGGFVLNNSKFVFNFIGRVDTHPIREELVRALKPLEGGYVRLDGVSPQHYAKILRQSDITLAPRGYGGSSFRFYEAIQAGSVPWLVGDIDSRPFKHQIAWSDFSLYSKTVPEFLEQFEQLTEKRIRFMREAVRENLRPKLRLGHWSWLLIQELRDGPQLSYAAESL